MLLALTSSARAHELSCLKTKYLVKRHTGYIFHFGEVTKTAQKGKLRPSMKLFHFRENKKLYVYLQRSSNWWSEEGLLLLGLVKPHKPVSHSTVSRWIVEILSQVGIDISKFSAHSTRSYLYRSM